MNSTFVVEAVRASVGEVYLVGGAVRDTLMGKYENINDYDFSTPLSVKDVIARLEDNGYKVLKHSSRYGTVSAIIGQVKVEISTFRSEEYTDRSKNTPTKVEFHDALEEDLIRRDFTINAIAHDGERYIDPFGGQNDIISEKIRAVGNASLRFEEDPIRMLRALRFVSDLGFTLTNETYDGILQCGNLIKIISPERLFEEFSRVLIGSNWTQALSLAVESGLIEIILDTEFGEEFIDVFLTNLQIKKNEQSERFGRWFIFLDSVIRAWSVSHRTMSLNKTLDQLFDKYKRIFKWSNSFSDSLYDKLSESFSDENLSNLELEHVELVKEGNSRQHIVLEKILRLRIRHAVNERALGRASSLAKESIVEQNFNLEMRLEKVENKGEIIREHKEFLLDTVRYVYLKYVEKNGFIESETDLNKLFNQLIARKDTFDLLSIDIGIEDRKRIVEESILYTNHILNGRLTSLSSAEIQDKNKYIKRTPDRLQKIKNSYVRELVKLRKPPYEDDVIKKRMLINLDAARVQLELFNGEVTVDYYSHLIDHYKWKILMAKDIAEFYEGFDKMNSYLDLIEDRPAFAELFSYESQYLYTAQCLTYAVTLVSDIDEKISLVRNIVANYRLVKYKANSKRHAQRYQLLLEWLSTGKELLASDYAASFEILQKIPNLKSYHYRDDDESYVLEKLPEIDKVRSDFYNLEAFLSVINNVDTDLEIRNETLSALTLLKRNKVIDDMSIYEVFKNILHSQLDESIPLEPISFIRDTSVASVIEPISETLELIRQGESENVEFKESWRYDVNQRQIDPLGNVLESAIKTIAAFMNTTGGTLILGVRDVDQSVVGLEGSDFLQFKKKAKNQLGFQDGLRKLIDDNLRHKIGSPALTLIKVDFEIIDNKTVCSVKVSQSHADVFFNDKYYVRHTGSTVELSIKDYSEYKSIRMPANA